MQPIRSMWEINMLMTENVSFKIYRKKGHPQHKLGMQQWEQTEISDTLNIFDNSENRTPILIVEICDDGQGARQSSDGQSDADQRK